MRLEAWLKLTRTKKADFAKKIGVAPATVTRVIDGLQNIPLSLQDRIFRATEGAVSPNDLHEAYAKRQAA